jgi:OFA family oxalate/formate antiporter-like MFS transporter
MIGGFGMGFLYTTTIALAQRWYPHKKGLITGIIVAALGFGGVIFTPLIANLIVHFGGQGIGEFNTFKVLSVIFLVVCSAGSIFMKEAPDGYMMDMVTNKSSNTDKVKHFTSYEMLKTPQCYLLILSFILAVVGGLMMIAFAEPIAVSNELRGATIGVMILALFNSIGRIFWGMVSDKIGRFPTLIILLVSTACLALTLSLVSGYIIYVILGIIGFCFGGILSNFPALTSDLFGSKYMGANYGIVLLGFGGGAVIASQVGGHFKNIALYDISLMSPAFIIAASCAGLGTIIMLFLRRMAKN